MNQEEEIETHLWDIPILFILSFYSVIGDYENTNIGPNPLTQQLATCAYHGVPDVAGPMQVVQRDERVGK
jgi:hypothetical protein